MKIAVIAPISPFRSGIAKSSTLLCDSLAKNNEVTAYSFKRLYPKLLYKGKFQKSETSVAQSFKRVFCIDSLNPLSWIETGNLINKENPDLVIFEWWTPLFMPCFCFLASQIRQKNQIAIIQNVLPHESFFGNKLLSQLFFRQMKRFVVLGKQDAIAFRKEFGLNARVLIEPAYPTIKKVGKIEARKRLGLPLKENIVLFFGLIREYKRLDLLIDAISFVPAKLCVVGEWWVKKSNYSFLLSGLEQKVIIRDAYVSDYETMLFMSAADVLVLPYEESAESAVLQLGLGYRLPMICSPKIGNSHLITDNQAGLILKNLTVPEIAKTLNYYFQNDLKKEFQSKMKTEKWTTQKEKILLDNSIPVHNQFP